MKTAANGKIEKQQTFLAVTSVRRLFWSNHAEVTPKKTSCVIQENDNIKRSELVTNGEYPGAVPQRERAEKERVGKIANIQKNTDTNNPGKRIRPALSLVISCVRHFRNNP